MRALVAERSSRQEHPGAGSAVRQAPATRRVRPPTRGGAWRTSLRLVAADGRLLSRELAELVRTNPVAAAVPEPAPQREPAPHRQPVREPQPAAPQRQPVRETRPDARRQPVRLTRRGRLVVTVATAVIVVAISVLLAGAAQARGHSGAPAGPGPGITKIQVRPGQNLWSLAEAYDPNADTRQVIQEILQLNTLSTDQVQPGQVLWMPRG